MTNYTKTMMESLAEVRGLQEETDLDEQWEKKLKKVRGNTAGAEGQRAAIEDDIAREKEKKNPDKKLIEDDLGEAKMSSAQVDKLKKVYEPMRDKKISASNADKLSKLLDMVGKDKDVLIQLFKANIPFVSQGAVSKLISKHNMKGAEINKLREEVEIDEEWKVGDKAFYMGKRVKITKVWPKGGYQIDGKTNVSGNELSIKEQLAKIKGNSPADKGRKAAVEDDIERAEKKGDKKEVKKLKEDDLDEGKFQVKTAATKKGKITVTDFDNLKDAE